jgi:hypothetical protein
LTAFYYYDTIVAMLDFIETLSNKQALLQLSDAQFAKTIGVTRFYWQQIQKKRRKPGAKLLNGVMFSYPDLASEIVRYLSANGNGNGNTNTPTN